MCFGITQKSSEGICTLYPVRHLRGDLYPNPEITTIESQSQKVAAGERNCPMSCLLGRPAGHPNTAFRRSANAGLAAGFLRPIVARPGFRQ